jgi:hypothetical protein
MNSLQRRPAPLHLCGTLLRALCLGSTYCGTVLGALDGATGQTAGGGYGYVLPYRCTRTVMVPSQHGPCDGPSAGTPRTQHRTLAACLLPAACVERLARFIRV